MIIKAANWVKYYEQTDTREPQDIILTGKDLTPLYVALGKGEARIEMGLMGWPPYNATLFSEEVGVWHVSVDE